MRSAFEHTDVLLLLPVVLPGEHVVCGRCWLMLFVRTSLLFHLCSERVVRSPSHMHSFGVSFFCPVF